MNRTAKGHAPIVHFWAWFDSRGDSLAANGRGEGLVNREGGLAALTSRPGRSNESFDVNNAAAAAKQHAKAAWEAVR